MKSLDGNNSIMELVIALTKHDPKDSGFVSHFFSTFLDLPAPLKFYVLKREKNLLVYCRNEMRVIGLNMLGDD